MTSNSFVLFCDFESTIERFPGLLFSLSLSGVKVEEGFRSFVFSFLFKKKKKEKKKCVALSSRDA
jgi:hypothetical protein